MKKSMQENIGAEFLKDINLEYFVNFLANRF